MKKLGLHKRSAPLPTAPKTEVDPEGVVLADRPGLTFPKRDAKAGKFTYGGLKKRPGNPSALIDHGSPSYAPVSRDGRKPEYTGQESSHQVAASHYVEAKRLLESFAQQRNLNPADVTALLKRLLADQDAPRVVAASTPPLPDGAPEVWAKRDLNLRENAPQFIRRVYGPWLGHALTRKQIKARDPELYRALSVWLTRHPEDEITEVLPRQSDVLDELIERLSAEFSLEDLRKLGYGINARLRRDAGNKSSS